MYAVAVYAATQISRSFQGERSAATPRRLDTAIDGKIRRNPEIAYTW